MFPRVLVALVLASLASGFAQANVVVSQIYGGGGNSGATYRNDFIELFNRGSNAVSLSGWSLQYASASGTTWQVTPLSGSLGPKGYWLVQQGSGGTNGSSLPAPDVTGTTAMSATAGKVALVTTTAALSGACPLPNGAIADFVGYGSSASCAEGNRAPAHGNTASLRRLGEGCADTEDNAADWFTGVVSPRNSASPPQPCEAAPRVYRIHEIQGTNEMSPLAGQFVSVSTNIVTGIRNNGLFLQSPPGGEDGNPLSSEGVFVLTAGSPGTNVQVGHAIALFGTVTEFRPANDPASPPRTQINAGTLQIVSAGHDLPPPVSLTAEHFRRDAGLNQLERFEGMRVSLESVVAASPTEGFVNEPDATGSSSGVFFGAPFSPRPFREPGIGVLSALPPNSPCCVPRFDENPELLRFDTDALRGATSLEVASGMVVGPLVGPLFCEERRYTLLPDPATPPSVRLVPPVSPVPAPTSTEITIACLNLERFYDTVDDSGISDVQISIVAYSNRVHKTGRLLRDHMHAPEILGLAEIENLGVLRDLASVISSNAYAAWLFPGNDFGGINVGFLVNTARVNVIEAMQAGKDATFTHPGTGAQVTLHDRPPLLMRVTVRDRFSTNSVALTLIMNHLRSLLDIDHPTSGAFVRAKRRAQAEYVAQLAQQRQSLGENVVVMGDFNAFEFNDGYVDVMGTIIGSPTPPDRVVLSSSDLVEPDLINLIDDLPPERRYSYVFEGTPQALDHILVSRSLRRRVNRFLYVRGNADSPESIRSDPASPQRVSDHDAAMIYVLPGTMPRITAIERRMSGVAIEGEGSFGKTYGIERSATLSPSGWMSIGSATPNSAERFTFTDENAPAGTAFYRMVATD